MDFETVPIERVRDFWDGRPCNIKHSPKPVGSREFFDEVEARKYFVEPHIPRFAEFEKWRGKKVLEIGCGIGTDTMNFARHGASVAAVDLSEKSLEIAYLRRRVMGDSEIAGLWLRLALVLVVAMLVGVGSVSGESPALPQPVAEGPRIRRCRRS